MTWCYRITIPRDGRLGKLIWEVSTARSKMKSRDSLCWFRLFQTRRSDIHVGWIKWRAARTEEHGRKEKEGEYLPTPPPPLPTPAPQAVFSCSLFFALTLRAEALRSPPHYRQSSLVLRANVSLRTIVVVKNNWQQKWLTWSRTTIFTASKFKYYQSYSQKCSGLGKLYITHLSHDRLRAKKYFRLDTWSLKSKWKQSQKINVTILSATFSIKAFFKITVEQHRKTWKGLRSN